MKRRGLLLAVLSVQLTHLLVLLSFHLPTRLSNAIQLLPPALALLLCIHEARRETLPYFSRLWYQLGFGFLIWFAGQVCYFTTILGGHEPAFPSIGDFLWMLYAFPFFLVFSNTQDTTQDWVPWLDIGQACISIGVLYALMFSTPALISVGVAYDVQGIALLLVCALRYSVSMDRRERLFFRNLGIFLIVEGVCCAVGNRAPRFGFPPGSIFDLAWTLPFSIFCVLALEPDPADHRTRPGSAANERLRMRLHGVGAFSLALMTVAACGFLAMHRAALGMLALTAAFILFAARTSLREMQLYSAHSGLELASLHDSLTGLANRKLLLQELTRCIEERERGLPGKFAVLFVDLDRFKIINDSLGHAYGDRLLVQAAARIRAAVRPQDILARLGGDEFVILLEHIYDIEAARELARRIISDLQQPLTLEGRVTYLNASIGIVLGTDVATGDEMLRNADCAMYEAKAMGKGRARIFAPAMLARATEELLVETDLRAALNQGGISVWYQPIYAVDSQRIHGFEALARWNHPERGLVSPAEFIPIAEDTGLIIELGKQVLTQACLQVRDWNALYQCGVSVSVNVSARQFADPNLIDDIMQIVTTTRIDPRFLKLEITESVLIGGLQSVKCVLEQAREAGIEIYLDDFGTGYSSLSYLLDFPFDVVKIDRSFIHNLEQDERRTEVVRMIIQLTRNLRKRAIAEGVETAGEFERLQHLGCDLVQGFLLSKPLPPDAMSRLVAQSSGAIFADRSRLGPAPLLVSGSSSPALAPRALDLPLLNDLPLLK
ncbi:MAG TPA: EAL domain-containing protein [Acidisarcina sp.]